MRILPILISSAQTCLGCTRPSIPPFRELGFGPLIQNLKSDRGCAWDLLASITPCRHALEYTSNKIDIPRKGIAGTGRPPSLLA